MEFLFRTIYNEYNRYYDEEKQLNYNVKMFKRIIPKYFLTDENFGEDFFMRDSIICGVKFECMHVLFLGVNTINGETDYCFKILDEDIDTAHQYLGTDVYNRLPYNLVFEDLINDHPNFRDEPMVFLRFYELANIHLIVFHPSNFKYTDNHLSDEELNENDNFTLNLPEKTPKSEDLSIFGVIARKILSFLDERDYYWNIFDNIKEVQPALCLTNKDSGTLLLEPEIFNPMIKHNFSEYKELNTFYLNYVGDGYGFSSNNQEYNSYFSRKSENLYRNVNFCGVHHVKYEDWEYCEGEVINTDDFIMSLKAIDRLHLKCFGKDYLNPENCNIENKFKLKITNFNNRTQIFKKYILSEGINELDYKIDRGLFFKYRLHLKIYGEDFEEDWKKGYQFKTKSCYFDGFPKEKYYIKYIK